MKTHLLLLAALLLFVVWAIIAPMEARGRAASASLPQVISVTDIGQAQKIVVVKIGSVCQAVYESRQPYVLHSSSGVTSWSVPCP